MKKFLCWIGLHSWNYVLGCGIRSCDHCKKRQERYMHYDWDDEYTPYWKDVK